MYSINFTENNKRFCLRFILFMEQTVFYLLMVQKFKFKAKDSEIVATPLCLEKFSNNSTIV